MNNLISDIRAHAVINSRGREVIAVTVEASDYTGTFALPEGASTGSAEVHVIEVRDALHMVSETLAPLLKGKRVDDQKGIDAFLHEIDGTERFEKIGGNVALGVSVAACKAAAAASQLEVWEYIRSFCKLAPQQTAPRLFVNLINGGKHAPGGSPIQEHQIIPDTDDVALAYEAAKRIQSSLEEILKREYGSASLQKGDEGGFVTHSEDVFAPFQYLQEAIDRLELPLEVHIGADIAASSFYEDGRYTINSAFMDAGELLHFYTELHERVPSLAMVEDPFYEGDGASYAHYQKLHPQVLIIGDDLTTTNVELLERAVDMHALSGVIIKPNQIGTLSDTLRTMEFAHEHDIRSIVSHRSGETMDDFIADLAWATGSYGFKAGAPNAKERDVKYERLIQIQKTQNV
jgi:enolase